MPRLRVQVLGTIAGAGRWSNTVEFMLDAMVASQAALQTIANATRTALNASTDFTSALCTDTTVTTVKMLHYPVNTGTANLVAESSGAAIVGTATPTHAPQVAAVASLRTGNAGRSNRGRIYVPLRSSAINPAGVLSSSGGLFVAKYANALQTSVVAACAASAVAASWVVWSPTKGTAAPVAAILVGNQCDTIRHRNMNRDEVYTSTPVAAAQIQATEQSAEEYLDAIKNGQIHFVGPEGDTFAQALLDVLPVPIP